MPLIQFSKQLTCTILLSLMVFPLFSQSTEKFYLSGTDKDHTVPWDFFCTHGRNSGKWTTIPVPSNWELHGFGEYTYGGEVKQEEGLYRHSFNAPSSWKGKKIFIVFEGSMADTEVKINGKLAGAVHQGGFYQFSYDVSSLVKPGIKNLLEVRVKKMSLNESVLRAECRGDFWALGGIYRPVYLEVKPSVYIDRVAIDAKASGSFMMDVFVGNVSSGQVIEATVQTLQGETVGQPFSSKVLPKQKKITLSSFFSDPRLWSPEFPNLYNVVVTIKNNREVIHSTAQRFGFRTVEVRVRDGIYVNGKRVIFKGVNRHSFWPESGRTLSKEISLMDVGLIKDMNMNAVRMSHYPPDQHFLDVCDSLGLFVLDELTGWQAKYDTEAGRKLIPELINRDVNHPSVVMWANGNEGGWNAELDDDFALHDIQKRFVYHPWEKFRGTDTKHYPDYNYVANSVLYGQEIFFPTEFMHGLYDGGHGAGLEDFWNLMMKHPYGAGGFLWAFHDEGVVRHDKNNSIDTHGNNAPDGILGPYREKEGSFFTIKEIWSPIKIINKTIPAGFDGILTIENQFIDTDLKDCSFEWKLVSFPSPKDQSLQHQIMHSGKARHRGLAPGHVGELDLELPAKWFSDSEALYVTAYDPHGREVFTWTWSVGDSKSQIKKIQVNKSDKATPIEISEDVNKVVINCDNIRYYFNRTTGYLDQVVTSNGKISLSGGPFLAGVAQRMKEMHHRMEGDNYIVEVQYEGDSWLFVKWIFSSLNPVKLEYRYGQKGDADFMGISFRYPEDKITGFKWLGRGPYRVWKNRLKGQQFGVWHKGYNDVVTGESWDYPEFKGYHSEVDWVVVENRETPFCIYSENSSMFFQMLTPKRPAGASNEFTSPPFPDAEISFLQAISPIGTKFQSADKLGPQSQKSMMLNYTPVEGVLWFDFGF